MQPADKRSVISIHVSNRFKARTLKANNMKVFVPFTEELFERWGLNIGELVPFQLEYECLRREDRNDISHVPPIADDFPSLTADLHS